MTEHAVYISYAEEDRRAADIIQSAIEKRGIPCESTPSDVPPSGLSESTEAAIAQSRVLIVIYSHHANGCLPLTREVEYASSHDIFILPFRIEDTPMSKDLEFYLSTYHWFDAVGDDLEDVVNELVERVEDLVTRPASETSQTKSPDEGKPSFSLRTLLSEETRTQAKAYVVTLTHRWSIFFQTLIPEETRNQAKAYVVTLSHRRSIRVGVLCVLAVGAFMWFRPAPIMWSPSAPIKEMEVALPGGVNMAFVWCPPGKFMMGSGRPGRSESKPKHKVTLTKGFWMAKYEVTQEQWKTIMGDNPSRSKSDDQEPVTNVSWDDCKEFIEKLNQTGVGRFRLPTEAQWEYACRAGSNSTYSFGNSESRLSEYAWHEDITEAGPEPVGLKYPNSWGLYDMHGNVAEWCEDTYAVGYPSGSVRNPTGPGTGLPYRVVRGGAFDDTPYRLGSAWRDDRHHDDSWSFSTGFRLCRDE